MQEDILVFIFLRHPFERNKMVPRERRFATIYKEVLKKLQCISGYDKWVPITMAWPFLRLRMEEWPPVWRVAANILNMQLQTAVKG